MKLLYSFLLLTSVIVFSCEETATNKNNQNYTSVSGEVFGTYYRIQTDATDEFKNEIDSIFKAVNIASNVYEPQSQLSQLNETGELHQPSTTLKQLLQQSDYFYTLTDGYFNPALSPIIQKWGFGFKHAEEITAKDVDYLLTISDFKTAFTLTNNHLTVNAKGVSLDVNGLAEGYTIDAICALLDSKKSKNYLVEIGGEMRTKGVNASGKTWTIGIENPRNETNEQGKAIVKAIKLNNKAISSSGSYRKFYTTKDGQKMPHIIDPKTGYPVQHHLLSVSIIAEKAITADAVATACMAMGTQKAKQFIESHDNLEGLLITDNKGKLEVWKSAHFPK